MQKCCSNNHTHFNNGLQSLTHVATFASIVSMITVNKFCDETNNNISKKDTIMRWQQYDGIGKFGVRNAAKKNGAKWWHRIRERECTKTRYSFIGLQLVTHTHNFLTTNNIPLALTHYGHVLGCCQHWKMLHLVRCREALDKPVHLFVLCSSHSTLQQKSFKYRKFEFFCSAHAPTSSLCTSPSCSCWNKRMAAYNKHSQINASELGSIFTRADLEV